MNTRDNDFIRRALLTMQRENAAHRRPSLRRIAALTIYGPADGFHIGFDRAVRIVYDYRRRASNPDIVHETPSQVRARHLSQRVARYLADHPKATITSAVTRVLADGGAPRFYFSVDHGMRLLRKHIKINYEYNNTSNSYCY